MKILSLVEGATQRSGTREIRVPGAVGIGQSLADRGHQVVVCMGGPVVPDHEKYLQTTPSEVLNRTGNAFGVIPYSATEFWSFSPGLIMDLNRNAGRVNFIILHSLYSFPVLAGYLMARKYRKPYAIWLHGVLAPIQRTKSWRKKWIYDRLIGNHILKHASMVVYTAKGEYEETLPLRLTSPAVLIPLGMRIQDYTALPPRGQFRTEYLSGYGGPIVLYLGRLNVKKGLDLLAKSMKLVLEQKPEARLVIVGGGDPPSFAATVREWCRASGLDAQAVFTGPITDLEKKKQVFVDADVFVLPSHAENFGFAMFEAMASRVPVVISNTLNYAAEVSHYQAGLVVRRDPQEIAKGVLRLLGDNQLRQVMGENGLRLAQAYSWNATALRLERVINSILHDQPIPPDISLH
jgi:glycosyltransferase involved in cell wall biosynthesis